MTKQELKGMTAEVRQQWGKEATKGMSKQEWERICSQVLRIMWERTNHCLNDSLLGKLTVKTPGL